MCLFRIIINTPTNFSVAGLPPYDFPLPALTSKRPITGLESAPKLPTRSNALFRAVSQFFSGLRICSILGWEFPLTLLIPQMLTPQRSRLFPPELHPNRILLGVLPRLCWSRQPFSLHLLRKSRRQIVDHFDRDIFTQSTIYCLLHRQTVSQYITVFLLAGCRAGCTVTDQLLLLCRTQLFVLLIIPPQSPPFA